MCIEGSYFLPRVKHFTHADNVLIIYKIMTLWKKLPNPRLKSFVFVRDSDLCHDKFFIKIQQIYSESAEVYIHLKVASPSILTYGYTK